MAVNHGSLRIIANPDVLEEDHLPDHLLDREDKIAEIERYLSPILKKQRPLHLWLYGDPGTGKTATARYVLEKMRRKSGIKGIYVNCWQHNSLYSILDYLTAELRILRAEEQRTARKLEKFQQYIKEEPFLLILDEVDQPSPKERASIIYTFCCLPKVGLINISNSCNPLFELNGRVKSRLNPQLVAFNAYTSEQLTAILTERAEEALVKGSYSPKMLRRITQLVRGDARMAVQTLKKTAWLAESERANKITDSHVRKAWSSTQEFETREKLSNLTTDHKILYGIVKYQGEILSSDLRQLYLLDCSRAKRRPIAERTFSDYVNDLKTAGLALVERARVRGKVRLVRTVK
jgi:cell division control protein 6